MTDKNINDKLGDVPSEKYAKFFEKFQEIHTLDLKDWGTIHCIGYFCWKFQDTFNSSYEFKYNSPAPSKSFESFQMKKLGQLLSKQPDIIKQYIDWVFAEKAIKSKIRFRSISFLTREDILQEYKKKLLSSKLDRTTNLPDKVLLDINKEILIGQYAVAIIDHLPPQTYGDVALLSKIPEHPLYRAVMKALIDNGITAEKLERII